jgi:hypothetical protein
MHLLTHAHPSHAYAPMHAPPPHACSLLPVVLMRMLLLLMHAPPTHMPHASTHDALMQAPTHDALMHAPTHHACSLCSPHACFFALVLQAPLHDAPTHACSLLLGACMCGSMHESMSSRKIIMHEYDYEHA